MYGLPQSGLSCAVELPGKGRRYENLRIRVRGLVAFGSRSVVKLQ